MQFGGLGYVWLVFYSLNLLVGILIYIVWCLFWLLNFDLWWFVVLRFAVCRFGF